MTIGLIEDDPIAAETIKIMTEAMGFSVTFEAQSFLQWQLKQDSIICPPDVYLIDLYISGSCKGLDIAHWIKSHSTSKIIFLTNSTDGQTLHKANALFPHRILQKPIYINDLESALSFLISKN